MSLRITQNQMYASFTGNMNKNLADMMESNLQASSQLKINRPSDDPVGAGRVISYRASIANIGQYQDNINSAQGWLSTADGVLADAGSVQTLLTRIMTLAQQGATGTYDKSNREQMSYELRQDFLQLINLANTTFEGRSIFAGHKTDAPAFVEGLGVTCNNAVINDPTRVPPVTLTATGGTDKAIVIQFGVDSNGNPLPATTADLTGFRYSTDAGKSWLNGTTTVNGNDVLLQAGGATLNMRNGVGVPVTAVDPENINEKDNGSWLYVRPSAIYQGDDNDTRVVTPYGSTVTANAQGYFTRDVAVRIDSINGTDITYSFSTDDGNNWTQGTTNDFARLPVQGGFLELSAMPAVGEQYIIHPRRADINIAISPTDSVTVNLVGKDVFGGLYKQPFTDEPLPVNGGDSTNMFEVVGRLVGAAETNSQEGMQKALEELKTVMNVIMTKAATVGGRENRLTLTKNALTMRTLDEAENLSNVEDVDVTELMTKLAQQQVAYNSVLKSSSMIMQMSLVNFL